LTIGSAYLVNGAERARAEVVAGNDQVTGFRFSREVSGRAKLHVDYSGKVSRKSSDGVFALKEGDDWYAYSQFESISARQAFPCFDEPEFKTPWQLSLRAPSELKAFSNYPEISSAPAADGMKLVRFAETRPLPSYLV